MPFASITRNSLEILNQNYRARDISPLAVVPARGDQPAPENPNYRVSDELIRVIPFLNAELSGKPMARQYQVRSQQDLFEPDFTARPAGTPWKDGGSTAFGQDLELIGARFKKISTVVRADESMVGSGGVDMLQTQIRLAKVGIVRALSEALLHSSPATDDNAELAGMPYFLPANSSQDVAYDPARKLIGGLSQIEALCRPSAGDFGAGPDVFVMSSRARWRLLKELEDKAIAPDFRYCAMTRRTQLHFHGVPVLIGRVPEPAGATPTTEAWALKISGPSAVKVLHLGGRSRYYGLRTERVTTMTTFDPADEARGASRGVEVFGVYSVIVPEPQSIARLRGIPARDPFLQP